MSTFSPVAMAGNAPHLPDDTRSRCIRVLLMPDVHGTVSASDWEEIEPEAVDLGMNLAAILEEHREAIRIIRPELPEGCTGRMREKWGPLARVAAVAGGQWPAIVDQLIRRDIQEVAMEREEGLLNLPPGMVLLKDLHTIWQTDERFLPTATILDRLVSHNPDYWSEVSSYGKRLTAQRMGRLVIQATKVHSTKNAQDVRGYNRDAFAKPWRQLGITLSIEPSETVGTVEPSNVWADPGCCAHGITINARCSKCGGRAATS